MSIRKNTQHGDSSRCCFSYKKIKKFARCDGKEVGFMQTVRLEELEALNPAAEGTRTIGYLVWYSIFDTDIPKGELEGPLNQYGLGEYMPNPITQMMPFEDYKIY